MIRECPTCGNEVSFNPYKEDGVCKYCKRRYKIVKIDKKNKTYIELEEKEQN